MIRIIVNGAKGRMGSITAGKVAAAENMTLAAAVDAAGGEGVIPCLDDFSGKADILIDFSHHTAAPRLMQWAAENGVAVVMCTTGHDEAERKAILDAAQKIPVFYSANMSLGVALLAQLAKKAAAAFPDADIEIVETHHNRKIDAPAAPPLLWVRPSGLSDPTRNLSWAAAEWTSAIRARSASTPSAGVIFPASTRSSFPRITSPSPSSTRSTTGHCLPTAHCPLPHFWQEKSPVCTRWQISSGKRGVLL